MFDSDLLININDVTPPKELEKYFTLQELEENINKDSVQNLASFVLDNFHDDELFYAYRSILYMSTIRPKKLIFYAQTWKQIFEATGITLSFDETSDVNLKFAKALSLLEVFTENDVKKHYFKHAISYPIKKFYQSRSAPASLDELAKDYKEMSFEDVLSRDDFDVFQAMSTTYSFSFDSKIKLAQFATNQNHTTHNISMLSFSAYYGAVRCFKFLVMNKQKITDSVLKWAIKGGNLEIIRICAQNNPKIGQCFSQAVEYHRNDVADWILATYDPDTLTMDLALEYYNIKAALYLEKHGLNTTNGTFIPFQVACLQGAYSIVDYLFKSDQEVEDEMFDTRLIHFAAQSGSYKIVELLLSKGEDPNARNLTFMTPLHYAAKSGSFNTVKLLLEKGANAKMPNLNGQTPLHFACMSSSLEVCNLLIENGADVNYQTTDGLSPLHIASQYGSPEITELLVANGANIHAINRHDETPLHFACRSGSTEVVDYLISQGAEIDAEDIDENTPLQLSIKTSYVEITQMLLERGANSNVLNY